MDQVLEPTGTTSNNQKEPTGSGWKCWKVFVHHVTVFGTVLWRTMFSALYVVSVVCWLLLLTFAQSSLSYLIGLSISFVFEWVYILNFLTIFEDYMVLVTVLKTIIISDIRRFAVVYGFVLISFSLAFHVMSVLYGASGRSEGHVFYAIYAVFCQMLGQQNVYGNLYNNEDDTYSFGDSSFVFIRILFMAYISVSAIVFLNLLIAMMNDSYNDTFKNAENAIKQDNMRMLSRIMWWELKFPRALRSVLHAVSEVNKPAKIKGEMRWRITIGDTEKDKSRLTGKDSEDNDQCVVRDSIPVAPQK